MFLPIRFRTTIQFSLSEISGDFETQIIEKLQEQLEGKCSRFGFIKPGTIIIEKRSCGKFIKQHFNGYINYEIVCKGEVCNPVQNTIVDAVVKNKNTLGILAESFILIDGKDYPVLDIIVPKRAAGISSEIDLDSLSIGDKFKVMVMGKCYQLNDSKISIIGRGVKPPEVIEVKENSQVDIDTENSDEDTDNSDASSLSSEDDVESNADEKIIVVEGGALEGIDEYDGIYASGDEDFEEDADFEEEEEGGAILDEEF